MENKITIYKLHGEHYAIVEGDGWFLETQTLAYVTGDKSKVDLAFLKTLPGDSGYGRGNNGRYSDGEMLVQLEYDETGIYTKWGVLRCEQESIFELGNEVIYGKYFEKTG